MTLTPGELLDLLVQPLPELSPPGFVSEQLAGLRSLPSFCGHLTFLYGLKALVPLAESPATAVVDSLLLAARILAAVGSVVPSSPDVTLPRLRQAAALAVNDLRPRSQEPAGDVELYLDEVVVLLEARELTQARQARRVGQSRESIHCAAVLVLDLWDLAAKLVQAPEDERKALIRKNGWAGPATAVIVRKLTADSALRGAGIGEIVYRPRAFRGATPAPGRK